MLQRREMLAGLGACGAVSVTPGSAEAADVAPAIDFAAIRARASAAASTKAFELDIAQVAAEAVEPFTRLLGTSILALRNVSAVFPNPDEIVVRGAFRVGIKIECEARFYREGAGVGYVLSFATRSPLDLLKGPLQAVADLVDIDGVWWTAASRPVAALDVATRGLEARALRIREGFENFHVKLDNAVLKALQLRNTVFEVALLQDIPSFSTPLDLSFSLKPVLKANFRRLTITRTGVKFDAAVRVNVLGMNVPEFPLPLDLKPDRVELAFDVPFDLQLPPQLPIRTLSLHQNKVAIEGSLRDANYGFSGRGAFRLPETGHGGSYYFSYRAGNTTPIPDVLVLTAETLTISDAVNLISPVAVVLPAGMDSAVTLRQAFVHYAAAPVAEGPDGTPIAQGVSLRSSVQVLGYPGYLAADVRPEGLGCRVLMNPLEIPNVVSLRGAGVRPPRDYRGPPFRKDAVELQVDTAAGTAQAGLLVELLGQPAQRLVGAMRNGALELDTRTTLPGTDLQVTVAAGAASLAAKGRFTYSADVDLPLMYGFNLRGLGQIDGVVTIDQPTGREPTGSVSATLKVLGFSVSTTFGIDPADIRNLAQRAFDMLVNEARKVLADAVSFVREFLRGAVQFTLATADALAHLATALVERFDATAQQMVRIMKDAGATATQALDLVRNGAEALGEFSYGAVIAAMSAAQFAAQEILGAIRDWARQFGATVAEFAENTAWLMREGGYALQAIAEEAWALVRDLPQNLETYVNALAWGRFTSAEVGRQLANLGVDVDRAGRVIGPIYGTDILLAALTPGYGSVVAARVAGDVAREMTTFSRNVGDEIRRGACRRFGFCW
ncbi:MAG: hypothetical protein AB1942_03445 [Pseudomonadota bacterium]